jgi:hypothetical protein
METMFLRNVHGVVHQRTDLFVTTAVRLSNPTVLPLPEDKILQSYMRTHGYFMFSRTERIREEAVVAR